MGTPSDAEGRRRAVQAASALLLVAVICSVYVATQDGPASVASLAEKPVSPALGKAAVRVQLEKTQKELANVEAVIATLQAKKVAFKTVIRSNSLDTSSLAAGKHFDHIKGQKLQEVPPAELFHQKITIDDSAREKAELEKREATHLIARHNGLVVALGHEADMNSQEAKNLLSKASQAMYEEAAYKNISDVEHNRTEPEAEAAELTAKYEENAEKLNGNEGYAKLLLEANQSDVARRKQWDALLAKEKNRTMFFPMFDSKDTDNFHYANNWPSHDDLDASGGTQYKSKGASSLHAKSTVNLRERSTAEIELSQKLTPGEHVEAISTLLLSAGGLLPMKSGEKATVLKVNTTSGVDTIITTDGKEGLFPNSDLAAEGYALTAAHEVSEREEETPVSKAPSDLHLPPAIRGNVVDAAVLDSEQTFATLLAREKARSQAGRTREQDMKAAKNKQATIVDRANESEEHRQEAHVRAHNTPTVRTRKSVVSSAIEEADARFESAKRAEIARSKEAREKRQEARNIRLRALADESAAVPASATPRADAGTGDDAAANSSPNTASSAPAVAAAEKAADSTFANKLEANVAKVAADEERGGPRSMSPALQAAVAAAEAEFDRKLAAHEAKKRAGASPKGMQEAAAAAAQTAVKTVEHAQQAAAAVANTVAEAAEAQHSAAALSSSPEHVEKQATTAPEQQVLQSKAVHAQAVNSGDRAVQRGLQTARAAYLEDRAREESRSLEKRGLENALKQRELQVHTATETVRGLRDALARQSDANKHLVVAQDLRRQADYIGEGIQDEETFSSMAQRGEISHSTQHSLAQAEATKLPTPALAAPAPPRPLMPASASAAASAHANDSMRRSRRAEEDERSLMAKALEEQAAATREDRQWQAQQRKETKMQQEEAAAVRSANTMYTTHMAPLKDIEAMSTYEKKLEREEVAYSRAHSKFVASTKALK